MSCPVCGGPTWREGKGCSSPCALALRIRKAGERSADLSVDQLIHLTHHHLSHGLSCDQYEALLDRANRRCELCGAEPRAVGVVVRQSNLAVDHDHETGAVRGMLCPRCNAHMRRVDAGERPVDEATARYLALATPHRSQS